jgi:hypothetical protein
MVITVLSLDLGVDDPGFKDGNPVTIAHLEILVPGCTYDEVHTVIKAVDWAILTSYGSQII